MRKINRGDKDGELEGQYISAFLTSSTALSDLSQDELMRRKAKMVTDFLFLETYLDTINGLIGGGYGRNYGNEINYVGPILPESYPYLGYPKANHWWLGAPTYYFVSNYRLPSLIEDIILLDDEPDGYWRLNEEYRSPGKAVFTTKYYNLGGSLNVSDERQYWILNIKTTDNAYQGFRIFINDLVNLDNNEWPITGKGGYFYRNAIFVKIENRRNPLVVWYRALNGDAQSYFDINETDSGWQFLKEGKTMMAIRLHTNEAAIELAIEGVDYSDWNSFKDAIKSNAVLYSESFKTSKGTVISRRYDSNLGFYRTLVNGMDLPINNDRIECKEGIGEVETGKIVDWNNNVMTVSKHGQTITYDFNNWTYTGGSIDYQIVSVNPINVSPNSENITSQTTDAEVSTAQGTTTGLIIDDNAGSPQVVYTGSGWHKMTYIGDSWGGKAYRTWNNEGSRVKYQPNLSQQGECEVYVWWGDGYGGLGVDVPYTIYHANGNNTVYKNQNQEISQWHLLGRYTFNAGNSGYVEMKDESSTTNRYVVADAIRFVYVGSGAVGSGINANHPPILDPIGNKTISEGQLLIFAVPASDPDGNVLTYTAEPLPSGAVFNLYTRAFTWTPDFTQAGNYNITFRVTDPSNLSASETITITVLNANRSPILESIGIKTINEGQLLEFTVFARDQNGDALTYSASNLPLGASFDTATHKFSWTPTYEQAGVYNVHFEVSDGDLIDSEDIQITVIDVNRNPVIRASRYPTSGRAPLRVYFSSRGTYDPDKDRLTYLWEFGDGSRSSAQNPVYIYKRPGIYNALLTVQDTKGGRSKASFKITVR